MVPGRAHLPTQRTEAEPYLAFPAYLALPGKVVIPKALPTAGKRKRKDGKILGLYGGNWAAKTAFDGFGGQIKYPFYVQYPCLFGLNVNKLKHLPKMAQKGFLNRGPQVQVLAGAPLNSTFQAINGFKDGDPAGAGELSLKNNLHGLSSAPASSDIE
jgi:hypothetical protein